MANILPHTDAGLLTADNCALVFIDHQPQMSFGVASGIDRQLLLNNVIMLAKGAKEYGVPVILTTVETESFSGAMWPQLLDIFPEQEPIERTGMNSWDTPAFREAIVATGKKNIILSGLWTEVCITWPTLNMLAEGYNIYVVDDACAGTSPAAHEAALSRMTQAGAVRMTAIAQVVLGGETGREDLPGRRRPEAHHHHVEIGQQQEHGQQRQRGGDQEHGGVEAPSTPARNAARGALRQVSHGSARPCRRRNGTRPDRRPRS